MKLALPVFFAGLFLLGVGAMVWTALDLPPVRLVRSHGFPPAGGGPTGRVNEIEGVRFVEIGTGYSGPTFAPVVRLRAGRMDGSPKWLGRTSETLGFLPVRVLLSGAARAGNVSGCRTLTARPPANVLATRRDT
jgi:hypothetical protein